VAEANRGNKRWAQLRATLAVISRSR
jgi:hypothetical protein